MSPADRLLDRLDAVRKTGAGRWIARCPAHDDRSPSLRVRELPDGRVLLHDFAGCDVGDVLAAIGLTLSDLFPESLNHGEGYAPIRERIHPADALLCIEHEATVTAIVASDAAEGQSVSAGDADRVALAASRIRAALVATGAET